MSEEFASIRKRILAVLIESERPLTIDEIAVALGLQRTCKSRLPGDLEHLARSIKRSKDYRLEYIPPICIDCGYVFKDYRKFKKPSKCPRCKSFRTRGPWFKVHLRSRKGSHGP